jgi:hypothetical protein
VKEADSSPVRALRALWRVVRDKGRVVVGFPMDYIDQLILTGITDLPGFLLAKDQKEAVAKATAK